MFAVIEFTFVQTYPASREVPTIRNLSSMLCLTDMYTDTSFPAPGYPTTIPAGFYLATNSSTDPAPPASQSFHVIEPTQLLLLIIPAPSPCLPSSSPLRAVPRIRSTPSNRKPNLSADLIEAALLAWESHCNLRSPRAFDGGVVEDVDEEDVGGSTNFLSAGSYVDM